MSKTVFILGAGASVHAGAPVMRDFLDRAESLLSTNNKVKQYRKEFDAVFDGIHKLQAVYAKSFVDLRNLEAVFVAFEMSNLLGRLPGGHTNVEHLPDALRKVIVTTLEESIEYPVVGSNISPPKAYKEFSTFLEAEIDQSASGDYHIPSIITFNYDCALDYALTRFDVQYGLEAQTRKLHTIKLLKLHGSMNWIIDEAANLPSGSPKTYVFPIQQLTARRNFPVLTLPFASDALQEAGKMGFQTPSVIIVPPTASKANHHLKLKPVWQLAADNLEEAENVIISGYSLPPTDEFFRYLFALGTAGKTRIKRFLVFDIDQPGGEVDKRFRALLGPMAVERYIYKQMSFQDLAAKLSGYKGRFEEFLKQFI